MNDLYKDEALDKMLEILYGKFPEYFTNKLQEILKENFKLLDMPFAPGGRIWFNGQTYPIQPVTYMEELVYIDLHFDLESKLEELLDESVNMQAERVLIQGYFRRLLNASYSKKDIKNLLPEGIQRPLYGWAKPSKLGLINIAPAHIQKFRTKEKKYSDLIAERLLTNLLEYS